jgi:gliding motility-associated-like protein
MIYHLQKTILILLIIVYDHSLVKAQFQLNGDASIINCKCYQLTPELNNKAGSVWNVNLIDLNQSFDYNFTVNLGCKTSGADGMVFALQPLSTSIGSSGGQMGLGGVSPSLGVYIDTYQNSSHGDLINDHISINLNGDVIHTSVNNIAGPYDLGNVENCTSEPLRVTWDPLTTLMNVYYNNILVLGYTGDIINNVFNGNPLVYWGFTASTGGESNFHQFCIDVPDLIIDSSVVNIESEKCDQQNGSITGLNIIGGISPYSLSWNNLNSLSLDTFNLSSGNFNLEIIDGMGCIANHTFNITDASSPIINTSNINIKNEDCNQSNGSISNILVDFNADSIAFYWNNSVSDSLNIYNLSANKYELIVLDNNNCSDTTSFNIIDTNYHEVIISYNFSVLETNTTISFIQTSIDSSFINYWTFGDDSVSTDYEPSHNYNFAGSYLICLEASNEFNCYDTSCAEIKINPEEIIIPNIFSPNDDQINDEFKIKGINNRFGIEIYNRWGELVFEENPYLNNWNGISFKGTELNEGQYYYFLKNNIEGIKRNGCLMISK